MCEKTIVLRREHAVNKIMNDVMRSSAAKVRQRDVYLKTVEMSVENFRILLARAIKYYNEEN